MAIELAEVSSLVPLGRSSRDLPALQCRYHGRTYDNSSTTFQKLRPPFLSRLPPCLFSSTLFRLHDIIFTRRRLCVTSRRTHLHVTGADSALRAFMLSHPKVSHLSHLPSRPALRIHSGCAADSLAVSFPKGTQDGYSLTRSFFPLPRLSPVYPSTPLRDRPRTIRRRAWSTDGRTAGANAASPCFNVIACIGFVRCSCVNQEAKPILRCHEDVDLAIGEPTHGHTRASFHTSSTSLLRLIPPARSRYQLQRLPNPQDPPHPLSTHRRCLRADISEGLTVRNRYLTSTLDVCRRRDAGPSCGCVPWKP